MAEQYSWLDASGKGYSAGQYGGEAGKLREWTRSTVADGKWLNKETIKPFSGRDQYLLDSLNQTYDECSAFSGDLQNQINVIEARADVIDVVGSYHEFVDKYSANFDPTEDPTISDKDVVKILNDETSAHSQTYYRWFSATEPTTGYWEGVGSLEPYYSNAELVPNEFGLENTDDTRNYRIIADNNSYIQLVPNGHTGTIGLTDNFIESASQCYTALTSHSASWDETSATLNGNSGKWEQSYTALTANSASWNETSATLRDNSGKWEQSYTALTSTSGGWNKTSAWVYNNSANIVDASATLYNNSANWQATYSAVSSNSATWNETAYVPLSAQECLIGSGNTVISRSQNNNIVFIQGRDNSAHNWHSFAQGQDNIVENTNSFAQGYANHTYGQGAFAQGMQNSARGSYSIAMGLNNIAFSEGAIALGANNYAHYYSLAAGGSTDSRVQGSSAIIYSLAVGFENKAEDESIAVGIVNNASGHSIAVGTYTDADDCSFAQGWYNSASINSIAQGYKTSAYFDSFAAGSANTAKIASFAQGFENYTYSLSFAQGQDNTGKYTSLTQGWQNSANSCSIAQGHDNRANSNSITQGSENTADNYSIAQGFRANATDYSIAQGYTVNSEDHSFAQGKANNAASMAFAQGQGTRAQTISFAQGQETSAQTISFAQGLTSVAQQYSFAQGLTNSSNKSSFAQGVSNIANDYSIAQGVSSTALNYSQAFGAGTVITNTGMAIGWYNKTSADVAFVIGNGTSDTNRSDLYWIDHDGNVSAKGNISATNFYINGTPLSNNFIPLNQVFTAKGNPNSFNQTFNYTGFTLSAGDGVGFVKNGNTLTISSDGGTYVGSDYINVDPSTKVISLAENISANNISGVSLSSQDICLYYKDRGNAKSAVNINALNGYSQYIYGDTSTTVAWISAALYQNTLTLAHHNSNMRPDTSVVKITDSFVSYSASTAAAPIQASWPDILSGVGNYVSAVTPPINMAVTSNVNNLNNNTIYFVI